MKREFEYSRTKNEANKRKHGIDFVKAQHLWRDPDRVVYPAKHVDEERYLLIASHDDVVWSAIFTYRNKKIRIISVRKARENEKKTYQG